MQLHGAARHRAVLSPYQHRRTGRLHEFGSLGEVQEALDGLATRNEPLVAKLERQPGQKDFRYAHLLAGPVDAAAFASPKRAESVPAAPDGRLEELESEIATLKIELAAFREEFAVFRKQFD